MFLTFLLLIVVTKSRENNVLRFEDLEVFEGTLITTRYTVDADNIDQRFTVPDLKADMSTLKVTVQNSSTDSTTQTYTESTDIVQATSTSNIYFVQEVEDGQHEILFGDGVIGKKLTDGNIVILEYIVTNETLATVQLILLVLHKLVVLLHILLRQHLQALVVRQEKLLIVLNLMHL